MNISNIISVIALVIAVASFVVTLLTYRATKARISLKITTANCLTPSHSFFSLAIANSSAREVSFLGGEFRQDNVRCEFFDFSRHMGMRLIKSDLDFVYLAPYQACQLTVFADTSALDLTRPIQVVLFTSRRSQSFVADFSQLDNIKTYEYRKQCKRHREPRKYERE